MKYAETCWTYGVRFCKSNVMSNGHLSCMFILVHRIAYKKILQFSELQDYSLSFIRLLWSWRIFNLYNHRYSLFVKILLINRLI